MRFLNAQMKVVDQLHFAHDGQHLFAAGSNVPDLRYKAGNRGIDVWDLAAGTEAVERLLPDRLIAGFVVNPANGWLYVGTGFESGEQEDDSAYLAVNPAGGEPVRLGLTGGNALTLAVDSSGKWLVGAGYVDPWRTKGGWRNQRLIRWRHPINRKPVREAELYSLRGYYTEHIAIDPDGSRCVTHEFQQGRLMRDLVYELSIRNPKSGEVNEKVMIPVRTIHQLLFSPDGAWLVIRGGPSLILWDARDFTVKTRKISGAGKGTFTDIAFHPSGRFLAATSNDQTVKLYDTQSWELAKTFTWNIGRMRSIAFSPNGALAAAGSDTGKVVVWDVDL